MAALLVERSYLTLPALTIGIVSDSVPWCLLGGGRWSSVLRILSLPVEPMAALLVERAYAPWRTSLLGPLPQKRVVPLPHHMNSESLPGLDLVTSAEPLTGLWSSPLPGPLLTRQAHPWRRFQQASLRDWPFDRGGGFGILSNAPTQ